MWPGLCLATFFIMRHLIIILCLSFPLREEVVINSPKFVPVGLSGRLSLLEVGSLARIVDCESKGEPEDGKLLVASVVLNRAKKYQMDLVSSTFKGYSCRGLATEGAKRIARRVLISGPVSSYCYFFNPSEATDTAWVAYGFSQPGSFTGRHFFF